MRGTGTLAEERGGNGGIAWAARLVSPPIAHQYIRYQISQCCSQPPANLQKRWGHVLTDPARRGREAPRAKRALRKIFGISMLFCLIPCRLLALAAMGRPWGELRAQPGCRGRASRTAPC
jgi:hypothetical protein